MKVVVFGAGACLGSILWFSALGFGALDDALNGTATRVELVFEDRRQDHLAAIVEHRCIVDGIDQHLADGRQADERAVAHGDLN